MTLAASLFTLENSGLIRVADVMRELEYLFRHALVQDAAYDSLVRNDRRQLHFTVGETLERLYPDRLDELAAVLAHHFVEAGEARKAIAYSRLAARQAEEQFAYAEATRHLEAALELAEAGGPPADRATLREELGDKYHLLRRGGDAIAAYQRALDERWPDENDESRALRPVRLRRKILQTVAGLKWAVDANAYAAIRQARQVARESLVVGLTPEAHRSPHPETVHLLSALATDAWRGQYPPDLDAALQYARAAVEMAEQLDNPAALSPALGALAEVYDALSLLREHLEVARRRMAVCQSPGFEDLRERLDALRGLGAAHMYVGDFERALEHLREAEALAVRTRSVHQQFNALSLQSQCYFRLDCWDETLAAETKSRNLEQLFTREQTGPTCFAVALSASVHALRGEETRARAMQAESRAIMIAITPDQWQRNQHY